MATLQELMPLLVEPREDLGVEYKSWLDLEDTQHKATLAKAAIALANHGRGFIVLGLTEHMGALVSGPRPAGIPPATQDAVNAAIRRFAAPEFHCEVYAVVHPGTNVEHAIVSVPGGLTTPVLSRRDCQGVMFQNKCYVRKPGPRSEEPFTYEEWRWLFDRCLRAGRENMLDAIRAIVTGRVDSPAPPPDLQARLKAFCDEGRERWRVLTSDLPTDSPSRFPHGHYEMAFALVGAEPAPSFTALRDRLSVAREIKHTGWTPFLDLTTAEWAPRLFGDVIEAWVGRPARANWEHRDPSLCDYWCASRDGLLFTMRGYSEDGSERVILVEPSISHHRCGGLARVCFSPIALRKPFLTPPPSPFAARSEVFKDGNSSASIVAGL